MESAVTAYEWIPKVENGVCKASEVYGDETKPGSKNEETKKVDNTISNLPPP